HMSLHLNHNVKDKNTGVAQSTPFPRSSSPPISITASLPNHPARRCGDSHLGQHTQHVNNKNGGTHAFLWISSRSGKKKRPRGGGAPSLDPAAAIAQSKL
ncbi:hypothetical protein, partial [Sphingomonas carotinifaciens]|uniref:hypothetical protein n=1 Tax=Sphingomonas carotinifaciens TaxID=1166323 RepID=UPI001967E2A8